MFSIPVKLIQSNHSSPQFHIKAEDVKARHRGVGGYTIGVSHAEAKEILMSHREQLEFGASLVFGSRRFHNGL